MAGCTCENWKLSELSSALQDMHKDKKRIVVPMFQRGKRWNKLQQHTFIDSLKRGYPVGTMLFYETFEEGKQTYILVDGLQRGNSIRMYMNNPTEFFYDSSISDEFCSSVLKVVGNDIPENYHTVRSILTTFIKEQKTYKNLQYYKPAKSIADAFSAGPEPIGELIEIIGHFFEDRQDLYEQISSTDIPVIVYHGDENNLPDIFDRINSKGTPLDQYEVYAAAWPVNQRFSIEDSGIVNAAIKKYESFIEDGYIIHGYDKEIMLKTRKVNAFEYLFGLGKYLVAKFDILKFNKNLPDDTVNPISFELVNACLNDTDKIRTLYQNIYGLTDINKFEKALFSSIQFVTDSVSVITKFKGNTHSGTKLFHSKYQILSMIATTFKEMYSGTDYSAVSSDWNDKKEKMMKNLRLYYVYDIVADYWSEGGTGKIYTVTKSNRYMNDISPRAWRTVLDGFFEKSMVRAESKVIASPKSEEYVILNCIYLNTFTAMDQLSIDRFDVEHIATKDQMKKLIRTCKGSGLPISCIANLCYLPEYVNRSKKDKNFYQDDKYLKHVSLSEIENKYSFTVAEDLEWMDMPYSGAEDFEELKAFYTDFCINRFAKLKKLFCKSMGIDYEQMVSVEEEPKTTDLKPTDEEKEKPYTNQSTLSYNNVCIKAIENIIGEPLVKINKKVYMTKDKKKGYVFSSSKSYKLINRNKYWFAYRKKATEDIMDCEEQYCVFGCKDDKEVICMPVSVMEERTDAMNYSVDDTGNISHWHVVFNRYANGFMTQLLSRPDVKEVEIDKYKVETKK